MKPTLRFPEFSGAWQAKHGDDAFKSRRQRATEGLPLYSVTMDQGMVRRDTLDRDFASNAPDAQGFYKLDEISTRHNAKKDCSGDMVDEAGLDTTKFIQFNPAKDRMIICRSASLQACYGPLQRLP